MSTIEVVQPTPITPLLFEAVEAPTEPNTIVDLLLDVAGLVGIIIIVALAGRYPDRRAPHLGSESLA